MLEDDAVELDDVELGLAVGDAGVEGFEDDLDGFLFGYEEVGALLHDGDEGDLVREELGCVGGGELGDVEEGVSFGDEVGDGLGGEVEDYAVGGEDGDAGGFHVDEGHHHGGFGEGWRGEEGVGFVGVVGGGFFVVAVVLEG